MYKKTHNNSSSIKKREKKRFKHKQCHKNASIICIKFLYSSHMYHFSLNYIFLIHKKYTEKKGAKDISQRLEEKCKKSENITFFVHPKMKTEESLLIKSLKGAEWPRDIGTAQSKSKARLTFEPHFLIEPDQYPE